jgi:exodeoxyribonuclease VII small subunit
MSDNRRSAEAGAETAGTAVAQGARPDPASLSFEDALSELEHIVRGLEGGQQKLEDAIVAYERGAVLRRHCEAKLAEAESRVAAIVERADGSLALRPAD